MADTKSADQRFLAQWPAYAWVLQIPELRAIMTSTDPADQNAIQAKVENSQWWKSTEPGVRQMQALKAMDPAAWNQQTQQKEADVWDLYNSTGLKPNPDDVRALAQSALTGQWTQAQLKDAIVGHFNMSADMQGQIGEIQTNASQLKTMASAYYVPLDDRTSTQWSSTIASGEHKIDDYIPMLQEQAKSRFPTLSSYIDKGITPQAFFAPYQAEAAKLLETNPATIDLQSSPRWSAAIDYADPKTNEHRPMTISEFQGFVRSQPEWSKTSNALDQAATVGQQVLQTWGEVA